MVIFRSISLLLTLVIPFFSPSRVVITHLWDLVYRYVIITDFKKRNTVLSVPTGNQRDGYLFSGDKYTTNLVSIYIYLCELKIRNWLDKDDPSEIPQVRVSSRRHWSCRGTGSSEPPTSPLRLNYITPSHQSVFALCSTKLVFTFSVP